MSFMMWSSAESDRLGSHTCSRIASFEGKHWFAMPIASEGLEEAGNALAGYAIDRLTGVERNDNIF